MNIGEKKKRIATTIFKMIVIIITTYLLTYAWFTYNEKINVQTLDGNTNPVNNIEISLDNGATWQNIGDLEISSNFTFAEVVSSNGVDSYIANEKQDDGTPVTFTPAIANRDYLEYKVLFRAQVPTGIFLETKSSVVPDIGITAALLIGDDAYPKSIYGDFSKDLIAGAVRVAFVENTIVGETHTPQTYTKLVWAPNEAYEISYLAGVYSASITSSNNQDYSYIEVTAPATFDEARVENLKDNINASYALKTAGGDPLLTYISDENIKSITIRVWVEGNDHEAITALKGGKFKIDLSFVGISKTFDNVAPSVSADAVNHTITGFNTGMEFTTDYGNNWTTYTNNPEPYISDGSTVYVRKSETNTNYASSYATLNF